VRAELIGEVVEFTLDNKADPWSGGTIVVRGERIILPRNLLVDYPANRLSLPETFTQAPAECAALGESGMARRDVCRHGEPGAMATIFANRTNGGNLIAGEVHFVKGNELISGQVTFIDFANGFFRLNGTPGLATDGIMVRLDDPQGRHTVQQGPGCLAASPNCSADVRFALDPENYTITTNNGYPVCLPSTVATALRTRPAAANGTGDAFCPATNRALAATVPDSTRFAPIVVGDNVTIQGNREVVGGIEFVSSWALLINTTLLTRNDPTQPDYLRTDGARWDPPGFNANRIRASLTALSTLVGPQIDAFGVHHDPATNAPFETRLGSTVGNPNTGVVIAGPQIFFKFQYDVRFGVLKNNVKFDPCVNLLNAGTPCPDGVTVAGAFKVLSPTPRELGIRSRHAATLNPGVVSFDASGNVTGNGLYITPIEFDYFPPGMIEINPALASLPFDFEGVPWMADRRTSPNGCIAPGCESTPQPLQPFPFSGLDPRNEVPVPVPDRVLATAPFTGAHVPFPQIDPGPIAVAPVLPLPLGCLPPVFAAPTLTSVAPNTGVRGTGLLVTLTGTGLLPGVKCSFGLGISAACNAGLGGTSATAVLNIDPLATLGPRDVTVTNPDGKTATLLAAFTVTVPPALPAPVLSAIVPAPAHLAAGTSATFSLAGTGFVPGAICSFGLGVTASCNVAPGGTSASALIAVALTATPGARDVKLTNPDGQSSTLLAAFTVDAAATPVPPTASLVATINPVAAGGSTVLNFVSTNATGVTISPIGSMATTSGSVTVTPAATTTFIMTATGPGGSATSSFTVVVLPVPPLAPTAGLIAVPASIVAGSSSVLNFTSTNATAVTISPVGSMATTIGAVTVTPAATTTYIMTATGPGGIATASFTVVVVPPAPLAPTASLTALPVSIVVGQSSVLNFTSTNATAVTISPIGAMATTSGSVTVTPAATTTYTMTATGPGGSATASFTVVVQPVATPAPTAVVTALPATIFLGGSTVLSFTSTNATAVTISPIGAMATTSGSVTVTPAATTTYTMTATGLGGSASVQLTVIVNPALIFSDDFKRVGVLGPKWGVPFGAFLLDGISATADDFFSEAAAAMPATLDFRVDTSVAESPVGSVGLRLRASPADPQNVNYGVYLEANTVRITRNNGAGDVVLQQVTQFIDPVAAHKLSVTVTGTNPVTIAVSLDGAPVFTFLDASAQRLTAPGLVMLSGRKNASWQSIGVFTP
jgi:hypothetical protein